MSRTIIFTAIATVYFLSCLKIYAAPLGTASNHAWKVVEKRDDFNDTLQSLTILVPAKKPSTGWLSVWCSISQKKFSLNIVSGEFGEQIINPEQKTDNFRYRIDKSKLKIITMLQHIEGAASSNNIEIELVKDLLKGGAELTTQPMTNSKTSFIMKFDLSGATKSLKRLINQCK